MVNNLLSAAKNPLSPHSLNYLSEITAANFVELLRHLISNANFMKETAERSYSHALGFKKIVLAEGECGERVRLHLWDEKGNACNIDNADIHDHYWDFSSLVLEGCLYSRIYEMSETCGSQYYKISHTARPNGDYLLNSDGSVDLKPIGDFIATKGQVHHLKSDELHSIVNKQYTITLVLQGPRQTKENTIFRIKSLKCREESNIVKVPYLSLLTTIKQVMNALNENPSNRVTGGF